MLATFIGVMLFVIVGAGFWIYFFFIIPNRSRKVMEAERFNFTPNCVFPENKV
jgi:hypothetical protein